MKGKKILAVLLAAALSVSAPAAAMAQDFADAPEEAALSGESGDFVSDETEPEAVLTEENEEASLEESGGDAGVEEEIPGEETVMEIVPDAEASAETAGADGGFSDEVQAFTEENAESAGAGSSMATATEISLDSSYNGTISDSNTADYYQITLASSGKINLKATAWMQYIYYKIYDSNGNEIWYTGLEWDGTTQQISTDRCVYLNSGIYYFVVEKNLWASGKYTFQLGFTSSDESFSETEGGSNNSFESANKIQVSREYTGMIAENDEKDFYQFILTSSGKVDLTATAWMQYIYYKIYDEAGKLVWDTGAEWDSTTKQISMDRCVYLNSGTYYFVVEKNFGASGRYIFQLDFTSADESFAESTSGNNNTLLTANIVGANKIYRGMLALDDEKDFYRFTLNKTEEVTVWATAWIEGICYRIYDEDGNQKWNYDIEWNSSTGKSVISERVKLSKGVYYFCMEKSNSYGIYQFALKWGHTHSYKNVVTKTTVNKNGKITRKCSCGAVSSTQVIYYPKTVKLSAASYVYNGKTRKPSVKVVDSSGRTISSSNYTVSYSGGRKAVGKYAVKITFKGNYTGTVTKTFKIVPAGTSVKKLTAKSKGFKVTWKKNTSQTSGYQIQYSTKRSFSGAKTKTVSGNKKTSLTCSGLRAKTTYYVRVRTWKKVSGQKYYSSWSSVKSVKTK